MLKRLIAWLDFGAILQGDLGYHAKPRHWKDEAGAWLGLAIEIATGLAVVSAAIVLIFPA